MQRSDISRKILLLNDLADDYYGIWELRDRCSRLSVFDQDDDYIINGEKYLEELVSEGLLEVYESNLETNTHSLVSSARALELIRETGTRGPPEPPFHHAITVSASEDGWRVLGKYADYDD